MRKNLLGVVIATIITLAALPTVSYAGGHHGSGGIKESTHEVHISAGYNASFSRCGSYQEKYVDYREIRTSGRVPVVYPPATYSPPVVVYQQPVVVTPAPAPVVVQPAPVTTYQQTLTLQPAPVTYDQGQPRVTTSPSSLTLTYSAPGYYYRETVQEGGTGSYSYYYNPFALRR